MSEPEHAANADFHQQSADVVGSQYDPTANVVTEQCGAGSGYESPCWTQVTNPTEDYLKEAKEHRQMAADHRAASEELRLAEGTACAGLVPDARDISPFEYLDDIDAVVPLVEVVPNGRQMPEETVGAIVTFRAVPGLTAEWLQRVMDCHLARSEALGHVVPEMPDCPLVPRGTEAEVASTGTGFAVSIRSDDPAAAQEILARAKRLHPTADALR